jgi:hypothetical protein
MDTMESVDEGDVHEEIQDDRNWCVLGVEMDAKAFTRTEWRV